MKEYRPAPTTGLPQESFSSSRVLAHTYLQVVDAEFEAEGAQEQYSRYMDDIVVGTNSRRDALLKIQRVQFALERVGLYPSSVKTRILRARDFAGQYLKDENDYLGEIESRIEKGSSWTWWSSVSDSADMCD